MPVVCHLLGARQGAAPWGPGRRVAEDAKDRTGGGDGLDARIILRQAAELVWPRITEADTVEGGVPPRDWLRRTPWTALDGLTAGCPSSSSAAAAAAGPAASLKKQRTLGGFFGAGPAAKRQRSAGVAGLSASRGVGGPPPLCLGREAARPAGAPPLEGFDEVVELGFRPGPFASPEQRLRFFLPHDYSTRTVGVM